MYYEESCAVNAPSLDLFGGTPPISTSDFDTSIPAATCQQCSGQFWPRNARGGSSQRFCAADCRKSFHNSQRSQRLNETLGKSPASQVETLRDAVKSETLVETLGTPEPVPTPAPPVENDPTKFSWYRDRELVVVQQQLAIAVYTNGNDDIVIRQEGPQFPPDDDVWVVISRQNLAPLISRLSRLERGED